MLQAENSTAKMGGALGSGCHVLISVLFMWPDSLRSGQPIRCLPLPCISSSTTSISEPAATTAISPAERLELEDLRAEKERPVHTDEDLRSTTSRVTLQIHQIQNRNQNAQLIEKYPRNVFISQAKEKGIVQE
ncbi:MAG: hypothetical protein LQ346_001306 [Caloplaca aetnensis]|nr:MAG: hypothetical protein LQ346_001306 [Caloplaca aetnensis]